MPGRPILAKLCAQIEELGGDQYIFDQVVAGTPIREIMGEFGLSHGMLYHWLRAGGPERKKGYELAKKASADVHAELGLDAVEAVRAKGSGATPAEVSAAKSVANYRQWLASKRNREEYGDASDSAVQITLNLGDAHLDALRELGSMDEQPQLPEADYDILDDE